MFVKICGITRPEDSEFVAEAGADCCGFVFHPRSPRYIPPDRARSLPTGRILRAGVFVNQGYAEIARAADVARLDVIQLHGAQSRECAEKLGPDRVVRVFWPDNYGAQTELSRALEEWEDFCGMILLDAGQSLGGSGNSVDWRKIAGIRPRKPVILAGGLNPENIIKAIEICSPDGTDLNSGVESSPGVKDHDKISAALKIIRESENKI